MNKPTINTKMLQAGTATIWGAVLLGVSILTEAEENNALDWELMWVIVGGFLLQTILLNTFIKQRKDT